ncbi:MAG: L,D-transpeptidase [Nannocystales bacterium]
MKRSFALLTLSALGLASCNSASAEEAGMGMRDSDRMIHQEVVSASLYGEPDGEFDSALSDEPDDFEDEASPSSERLADEPAVLEPLAEAEAAVELEAEPEPIARRIARQKLTIFAKPTDSAPIRGRIPTAAAFDVFGYVDGPGCDGELGWADLGHHGFACMDDTRNGEGAIAYAQPKMRAELTPFYYAKVKVGHDAPRYRNLRALNAGADPIDTLKEGVDYAFVVRRRSKGQLVLIDDQRRVVREQDVRRFRPSRFEGRDLEAEPVPEGKVLAWVSNWPKAPAYSRASTSSELATNVTYHDQLLVEPADTDGWYKLDDGSFISTDDVRVFSTPTDRPDGVTEGEIWVDIDLEQQVLSVMLGDAAIYTTLVSSGLKSPTPRGLFRIHNKRAVGSMSSAPGADDFYSVQAVPHVQYFLGSFALHSAYWHDGFGRPISHGCVNLSPKDAKHVFSLTTPSLPMGWLHGYESTEHLGTTIRVRMGDAPVRDRRGEVEPIFGR